MEVKLLHATPLWVCSSAIRTCWDSHDKSDTYMEYVDKGENPTCGPKDRELIERVGNKHKHKSTLEHLFYNFEINGISRACLQEIARHRMASYSVKSTRYTLKELKTEDAIDITNAGKYIVFTGNDYVDNASMGALRNLHNVLNYGVSNDIAKFCLPESYKTDLKMSINARSLQNFIELRTNKAALWEIRDLAMAMYHAIPEEHKYLFDDYVAPEMF